MVDPTRAHLARLLKVADADIWNFEYDRARDQYTVTMRTGGQVLVTAEQYYALDDHRGNKALPLYNLPTELVEEVTPLTSFKDEVSEHVGSFEVPDGTTNEVVIWVDGDKDRAVAALEVERARSKSRVALIKQLERIVDGR